MLNKLQKLGLNERAKSKHTTAILTGDIATFLLVLCSNLKNLETFNLALIESHLISSVTLNTGMGGPLNFSNLTALSSGVVPLKRALNGACFEKKYGTFFCLPRLFFIRVDRCIGDYTQIPKCGFSPDAVKASCISLTDAYMDQETISALINLCKSVKSVFYATVPHSDSICCLDADGHYGH